MRVRIDLAYDGAGFAGWAKQPGLETVQGELESALAKILRVPEIKVTVAGRTDAGVHATGQVVHLDVPAGTKFDGLTGRLNSLLKQTGIHVHTVAIVSEDFDARFSPIFRRYEYRISDGSGSRDPRTKNYSLWVSEKLDLGAMNKAAKLLLGLHDWTTFCKQREGASSVRELQKFAWSREKDGTLVATIQADAFCHNMVRNLVGMCLEVGRGKLEPADAVKLRDARLRTSKFPVLPPQGLTLVEVGYPKTKDLAKRANATRAKREPI